MLLGSLRMNGREIRSVWALGRQSEWRACGSTTANVQAGIESTIKGSAAPAPGKTGRRKECLKNGSSHTSGISCGGTFTYSHRNEFFWTKHMSERVKSGQGQEALKIYKKMREQGVVPNTYTFVTALKACSALRDVESGKEIHVHVIESRQETHKFVANSLVDMYIKCGYMWDARLVFDKMPEHDVVSWTAIIMGYAQMKEGELALQLYELMQQQGCIPNARTFVSALKACASLASHGEGKEADAALVKVGALNKGRAIHFELMKSCLESDKFVASTLVDMYAKCGSMAEARCVFDRMAYRDVVSWNAMIQGYGQSGHGELALQLYMHMLSEGFIPDARTFVGALTGCASLATKEQGKELDGKMVKVVALEKGRAVHSTLVKRGLESDTFVANTLINMYAECGSMLEAQTVFDNTLHRDMISWNAMILGYAHGNEPELALQLYEAMQHEGFTPDSRSFIGALNACALLATQDQEVDNALIKLRSLETGREIHSQLARSGYESYNFVANSLVDMYAKCGSTSEARQVFDRMSNRDVVSWTTMILGYAHMEEGVEGLRLFAHMQQEGCLPNHLTFVAALRACSSLPARETDKNIDGKQVTISSLEKGRALHSQLAKCGFESDIFVLNTLVDMYAKCGSLVEARSVFDSIPHRDLVSWNAIIIGYVKGNQGEIAIQLYESMHKEGITPDAHTFVAALSACASLALQESRQAHGILSNRGCLEKGRAIHSQIKKSGLESDKFVANTLVNMYTKCGSMSDAQVVFDNMVYRDVVSWTAMILGFVQAEEAELALEFYSRMQYEGVIPNGRTYVGALKACAGLAALEKRRELDGTPPKIRALETGRGIHSKVVQSGFESDIFVANTLVDMYAKCGSMVNARLIFDRIQHRDVVSWNAIILGYAQQDESGFALHLYRCMQQEGFSPNAITFVGALNACGTTAALEIGMSIHADICKVGLEKDVMVAGSLIHMYSKCGSMVDSQQLFDALPARDLIAWTALIAGYSRLGQSEDVFNLFERMLKEGIQPDNITFLSVLTACSHVGLVDKGQDYFEAMISSFGVTPTLEHYNCMVDLLGRAGQLDRALAMVHNMPFKPNKVTWMTILGSCKKWNDVEIGRHAFECAIRIQENDAGPYVAMSNIYEAVGMHEESVKIQAMRMNAGIFKEPGQCWWTDSNGIVHTFMAGDARHPQTKDIYLKLKNDSVKMKEEGYVPDFHDVVHHLSNEEKENMFQGHSERLAIACALINTPEFTPIRIVKNLRVCDDCHKATSVLSKIEQRTIVCRDANRFHVFQNGTCSCCGFW